MLVLSVGLIGVEWLYLEKLEERRNSDATSDPIIVGDLGIITPRHIPVDDASPNQGEVLIKSEAVRRHVLLENGERRINVNREQPVSVVVNSTAALDHLPLVRRKRLQLRRVPWWRLS